MYTANVVFTFEEDLILKTWLSLENLNIRMVLVSF